MDDDCPPCKCRAGIPAWVLTFADLMSLLMCFFVLLLSFAEMDVIKYKQIAGSMKSAFGVQRVVKAYEPPKGVSIIAREFSPAPPQPTIINQVRQVTSDDTHQELLLVKTIEGLESESTNLTKKLGKAESEQDQEEIQEKIDKIEEQIVEAKKKLGQVEEKIEEMQQKEIQSQAMDMATALKAEIQAGILEVVTNQDSFLIRIKDKGAFPPGSARLTDDFIDVLDVIKKELAEVKGSIIVAGHTDNIPISSREFRSNWDLSAKRSASVVEELLYENKLDQKRLSIQAFADSKPLVKNDSADNRSKNRRVEIVVSKSKAELNTLDDKGKKAEEDDAVNKEELRKQTEYEERIERRRELREREEGLRLEREAEENGVPLEDLNRPEPEVQDNDTFDPNADDGEGASFINF